MASSIGCQVTARDAAGWFTGGCLPLQRLALLFADWPLASLGGLSEGARTGLSVRVLMVLFYGAVVMNYNQLQMCGLR
jgi:hypothetical protein